jgi:hypothetical protein
MCCSLFISSGPVVLPAVIGAGENAIAHAPERQARRAVAAAVFGRGGIAVGIEKDR